MTTLLDCLKSFMTKFFCMIQERTELLCTVLHTRSALTVLCVTLCLVCIHSCVCVCADKNFLYDTGKKLNYYDKVYTVLHTRSALTVLCVTLCLVCIHSCVCVCVPLVYHYTGY